MVNCIAIGDSKLGSTDPIGGYEASTAGGALTVGIGIETVERQGLAFPRLGEIKAWLTNEAGSDS